MIQLICAALLAVGNSDILCIMSDLTIWKSICEIRYPAAALLLDSRGDLARKWQKGLLTEWTISRNHISIFDKDHLTTLNVGLASAGVIQELSPSFQSFSKLSIDFFTDVLRTLKIEKVDRIGLRLMQIAERKDFSQLVRKMAGDLYKVTDDQWEPLGGFPEDIGLPLTLRLGESRANFKIGPMKRKQLARELVSEEAKKQLPGVFVFIDFDLFREQPPFVSKYYRSNIQAFLDDGEMKILPATKGFLDQFGGFE